MVAEQIISDIPLRKQGDVRISNRSILEIMTQTACHHETLVRRDQPDRKRNGPLWIVMAWNLRVAFRPSADQPVTARTWARSFTKVQAFRDFELLDETGNRFAAASSVWATIDASTRSVLRLEPDQMLPYGPEPDRCALPGIRFTRGLPTVPVRFQATRLIDESLIDANGHVHNSLYPELASPAFPEGSDPDSFAETEIQYIKEILPGESVLIQRAEESGTHSVWIRNEADGSLHASMILR